MGLYPLVIGNLKFLYFSAYVEGLDTALYKSPFLRRHKNWKGLGLYADYLGANEVELMGRGRGYKTAYIAWSSCGRAVALHSHDRVTDRKLGL